VATMVIARWEPGGRDDERFREVLDDPSLIEDIDVPEEYETPEEYAESHRQPAALPPPPEQAEEQAPAGR